MIVNALAALLLAAVLLPAAGCGKKGPLYLPEATLIPAMPPALVAAAVKPSDQASR